MKSNLTVLVVLIAVTAFLLGFFLAKNQDLHPKEIQRLVAEQGKPIFWRNLPVGNYKMIAPINIPEAINDHSFAVMQKVETVAPGFRGPVPVTLFLVKDLPPSMMVEGLKLDHYRLRN